MAAKQQAAEKLPPTYDSITSVLSGLFIELSWDEKKCKRWILVVDESLMLTKINKLVADCLLTGETCKSNRRAKFVR